MIHIIVNLILINLTRIHKHSHQNVQDIFDNHWHLPNWQTEILPCMDQRFPMVRVPKESKCDVVQVYAENWVKVVHREQLEQRILGRFYRFNFLF